MVARELKGKRFGKLVVLGRLSDRRNGRIAWECQCDCGRKARCTTQHLVREKLNVRSCGCDQYKRGSDSKYWKGYGEISGAWWNWHVLRENKQRTRVRVPVSITIQEAWDLFLKQERKCALTGLPLQISRSGSDVGATASIDRIDSSKGYETGNIQWVHKDINFMKRNYDINYFKKMCDLVCANNKGSMSNSIGAEDANKDS